MKKRKQQLQKSLLKSQSINEEIITNHSKRRKERSSFLTKSRPFTLIAVVLLFTQTLYWCSNIIYLPQSKSIQNEIVVSAIPPLHDRPAEENSKGACRVRIQNKVDWHHEVLESIALRFELPWHQFNCDIRKPIIFDFALFQNTFDNNPRG